MPISGFCGRLVALLLPVLLLAAPATKRSELIGRVQDIDGTPVSGATVFIWTAGPKVGTSAFCPSCYADCGKRATTSTEGEFRLEALDPALKFRLLVVGDGLTPTFVKQVDPSAGPVTAVVPRVDRASLPESQKLTGRVLDPEGTPIFGAVVNFDMVYLPDGRGCGGVCDEFQLDPVAVTDREGRFVMATKQPFKEMDVSIESRGLAKRRFHRLSSSQTHDLKLQLGATITGKLVNDRKPVTGATIGLVSVDRSENFTGEYLIGTDETGRFLFPNIPPGQEYYVYSRMAEAALVGGVAPSTKVQVGPDGSTVKMGDLASRPAFRLRGRVLLADGRPLPSNTHLFVGRNEAWDARGDLEIGTDGRFELTGIPAESIGFGLRVPGYRFSLKNPSLDRLNGFSLVGKMSVDLADFLVLLEPGEFVQPDSSKPLPSGIEWIPDKKPLRGLRPEDLPATLPLDH